MALDNKELFSNQTTPSETKEFRVPPHASEILISVFGDGSLDFKLIGIGGFPDEEYDAISFINNNGYSVITNITKNGKYYASVKGYRKIKGVLNSVSGSTSVVATFEE